MQKVFILGTGRCGTHSFNEIFNTIPNTFSMHEGIYYEKEKRVRISDLKEVSKYIYFQSKDWKKSIEEIRRLEGAGHDLLRRFFAKRVDIIKDCEKNNLNYIDVNPYGYWAIHHIRNQYPEAKFIHLVRNGYDTVRSFHLRENTTYTPGIDESEYSGYRSGKPIPKKAKDRALWKGYDRVQKISWFWSEVNQIIEHELSGIPDDNKILFKLEDLNVDSFSTLLSSLGISGDFNQAIVTKRFNPSSVKDIWTEKNIANFNKIAGKTMRHFGYDLVS